MLFDKMRLDYLFQPIVCGYIPDFLFPGKRIVELDGACHKDRKEQDRARDAALHKAGYKVLRIPSSLIFRDVDRMIQAVQKYLN